MASLLPANQRHCNLNDVANLPLFPEDDGIASEGARHQAIYDSLFEYCTEDLPLHFHRLVHHFQALIIPQPTSNRLDSPIM